MQASTREHALTDDAIACVEQERPQLLVAEMRETRTRPALDVERARGRTRKL
jgi:hypothetical protein